YSSSLTPVSIRLHNVAIADAGTYSVHVNMDAHGSTDREVQTVEVQVSGGSDTLLATQVVGNFFVAPGSSHSLQFLPNAGIRLHNVVIADAGTYSVHVNMDVHGSTESEVQTVEVQVS
ncbi:hypothetical protein BaRGS_00020057, partial [Batillaria attramentaria]